MPHGPIWIVVFLRLLFSRKAATDCFSLCLQDRDREYVGFATLPNQVHRKWVKRGFDFTLMVAGESGLGTSTLANSLFFTDLYGERQLHNAEGRTAILRPPAAFLSPSDRLVQQPDKVHNCIIISQQSKE
ncbi:septin-5-like [Arapaima gigas]